MTKCNDKNINTLNCSTSIVEPDNVPDEALSTKIIFTDVDNKNKGLVHKCSS